MRAAIRSAILLAAALLPGCVSFDEHDPDRWDRVERDLQFEETLCYRCGNVYLSEQPSLRTLETLERRGVRAVLDLREHPAGPEDPIRAGAEELHLTYEQLPVPALLLPDDATVDRFLQLVDGIDEHPILVFCERGTNTAMLFAVHRVVALGVDLDVALEDALKVGLRVEEAEGFVRGQVERLMGPPDLG